MSQYIVHIKKKLYFCSEFGKNGLIGIKSTKFYTKIQINGKSLSS